MNKRNSERFSARCSAWSIFFAAVYISSRIDFLPATIAEAVRKAFSTRMGLVENFRPVESEPLAARMRFEMAHSFFPAVEFQKSVPCASTPDCSHLTPVALSRAMEGETTCDVNLRIRGSRRKEKNCFICSESASRIDQELIIACWSDPRSCHRRIIHREEFVLVRISFSPKSVNSSQT